MYAPVLAETLDEQNENRAAGRLTPNTTLELRLSPLGLVNGRVDMRIQVPFQPRFAWNNTHGVQIISKTEIERSLQSFSSLGGCRDLLMQCENAGDKLEGYDKKLETATCRNATSWCTSIGQAYLEAGGNPYDITSSQAQAKVPLFFAEYLNQAEVQRAIGSPVNFTLFSAAVNERFFSEGEPAKRGRMKQLASLLRKGIQVGLIYGDSDYLCN